MEKQKITKENGTNCVISDAESAIQKQYDLIIGLYKSESGMFWTRFNIFTGIQLLALLGILSNAKVLLANHSILTYLLLLFALVSTLYVLICIRGILSSRLLLWLIAYLESKSHYLMKLAKMVRARDKLPQYINFLLALIIALLLSITWWIAFVQVGILHLEIVIQ